MTEPRPSRPPFLMPLIGLAVFLAAALTLALLYRPPPRRTAATEAAASALPQPSAKVELEVTDVASATAWIDVASPEKVREALFANAWLKEVINTPLGQGFLGGWGAFLGSKGEDLKASFRGAVLNLVAEELLGDPFRVAWLSTRGQPGVPVIIVEEAGASAKAAFDAIDGVARRGVFTAKGCPKPDGAAPAPEEGLEVVRWLLAEHSVFAALRGDKLVLGRQPKAVLQGLCAPLPARSTTPATDLAVVIDAQRLGREGQLLAHALGLEKEVALTFRVEGNAFKPAGFAGKLTARHFGRGSLAGSLQKLLPADVPVLLALNVELPETLDRPNLKTFLDGTPTGALVGRQIALAWWPTGDRGLLTEVAIAWSRPEDEAALAQIFSGPNTFDRGQLCGHLVLASTPELFGRMKKTCEGGEPSFANAAPAILQGFAAPSSIALGVHLGKLLSDLTVDGYHFDESAASDSLKKPLPPEIEDARRALQGLPYVGFRGLAEGGALVGGGFKS